MDSSFGRHEPSLASPQSHVYPAFSPDVNFSYNCADISLGRLHHIPLPNDTSIIGMSDCAALTGMSDCPALTDSWPSSSKSILQEQGCGPVVECLSDHCSDVVLFVCLYCVFVGLHVCLFALYSMDIQYFYLLPPTTTTTSRLPATYYRFFFASSNAYIPDEFCSPSKREQVMAHCS